MSGDTVVKLALPTTHVVPSKGVERVIEIGVFQTEMAHKNMTYPHNTSNERARRVDHGHLSFVTQNGILGTKIVL